MIAVFADIHARDKDLPAFSEQFRTALTEAVSRGCNHFVLAGDIFDFPNISTGGASAGDIINSIKAPLIEITSLHYCKVFIIPGQHDKENETNLDALTSLEGIPRVRIIREPTWVKVEYYVPGSIDSPAGHKELLGIAFLPWLYKESAWPDIKSLAFHLPSDANRTALCAHLRVQGARMNRDRVCNRESFSVTEEQLETTPFDRFWFGDFHERQNTKSNRGMYVGALRQMDFGHAGEPQGFEIYNPATNTAEFIEVNVAPRHEVLEWVKGETRPAPTSGFKTRIKTIDWVATDADSPAEPGVEITYKVKAEHTTARISPEQAIAIADDKHALLDLYLDNEGFTGDRAPLHETLKTVTER